MQRLPDHLERSLRRINDWLDDIREAVINKHLSDLEYAARQVKNESARIEGAAKEAQEAT